MSRQIKNAQKKNNRKNNLNNSNNSGISENIPQNEFSILNNELGNSILIDEEINNKKEEKEEDEKEDYSSDIFEKALLLMDENVKKGLIFTEDYEPKFSIISSKIKEIPIFTPSTRLNSALQVDDKNDCYFYYYIQKKSLYPTIYNQLIGISGSNSIFVQSELNERDFIWANLKSVIFTNQKNFINLSILVNEYINPLMKKYNKSQEEKKLFVEQLCNNILIQEYFTYDELLFKLKDLNSQIMEHKLNNIGFIIIDGLNTIYPQRVEVVKKDNDKKFSLKFYKYSLSKIDEDSNKKNKRFSSEKNFKEKKSNCGNSCDIVNLFSDNDLKKNKIIDINKNFLYNETLQQNIITLIMNYQEKYNFNLIITLFDFSQNNYYNSCLGGKLAYKDNKNIYTVNCTKLQEEYCYFTFKLTKYIIPKKIIFLEPINLCLNYNDNIFGLLTNPDNNGIKSIFQVFKKNIDDYRPTRILDKIEYQFQ